MKRESKMEEVKMKSEFLILDSDYLDWVKELSARYRKSQIKAAVKVNQEMLRFYWELGKDIVKLNAENKYGSNFYTVISTDLKRLVPNASGLSPSNIRYAKRFFELYSSTYTNFQQLAEKSETNLQLSCYVVIEVKIGKFEFADIGQLGGYVVSCNHILRKEGRDNPTIGLLICKEKDKIQAQYALESSSQPIGISEYELERFYPEKVEGTIPTIEEIEKGITRLAIYNEKEK